MCLHKKTPRLFYVAVCDNFHYTNKIQNTLLLILIMILRLFKYTVIVDIISLLTMTHIIYLIAYVYFKQYWMVIEHVHTTVLIRKKIK